MNFSTTWIYDDGLLRFNPGSVNLAGLHSCNAMKTFVVISIIRFEASTLLCRASVQICLITNCGSFRRHEIFMINCFRVQRRNQSAPIND